jgi:hypothetical protein
MFEKQDLMFSQWMVMVFRVMCVNSVNVGTVAHWNTQIPIQSEYGLIHIKKMQCHLSLVGIWLSVFCLVTERTPLNQEIKLFFNRIRTDDLLKRSVKLMKTQHILLKTYHNHWKINDGKGTVGLLLKWCQEISKSQNTKQKPMKI